MEAILSFPVSGDRLYDFMLYYLTEANLHKDPQKIQRVIKLMETISDAYHEIIESGKAERDLAKMGENSGEEPKKQASLGTEKNTETTKNSSLRLSF